PFTTIRTSRRCFGWQLGSTASSASHGRATASAARRAPGRARRPRWGSVEAMIELVRLPDPSQARGKSLAEFIYTLRDLRKVVGTDRIILDGITLAFYPGAKIGVVGPNGTGKSSLLR